MSQNARCAILALSKLATRNNLSPNIAFTFGACLLALAFPENCPWFGAARGIDKNSSEHFGSIDPVKDR